METAVKSLRSRLTKFSHSLRKHTLSPELSLDLPMSVKSDVILFDGQNRKRRRIVLLTTGCGVGTCTMCPFPNESLNGVKQNNIVNQFENSFKSDDINNYEMVTIFCNGNFFRDSEISIETRRHIYERIKNASSVNYLYVESLPQYITEDKIAEAKKYLGNKKLVVVMGLQSSNDFIRETIVNTTCTRNNFENAVRILQSNNFIPSAFVMIKPTFLLEDEAIDDSCNTIQYLASLGVIHSTLCPTRVAPDTVLEKVYQAGLYQPIWAQTVIEVLKRNADFNGSRPMVNTSELKQDMNLDSVCAYNVDKMLIQNLEKFLFTRDFSLLEELDKNVDYIRRYHVFVRREFNENKNKTLEQRVEYFLEKHNF